MTDNTKLQEVIQDFKTKYPKYKLLAISATGSTLFGTNTPSSDIDYRGIFAPDADSLLLKTDIDSWTYSTNSTNIKNNENDLDFSLWSVHKLFNLLHKMETNAVDLFFSLTQANWPNTHNPNVLFVDDTFKQLLISNKSSLITSDMRSFSGYALGQVKRYQIKGQRYEDLDDFIKKLYVWSDKRLERKLEREWDELKAWVALEDYTYVKFVTAPGAGKVTHEYISVLGRLFHKTVTLGYLYEHCSKLYETFGNRTTSTALGKDKVDFKALSHAYRIASEVKEVLTTSKIQFPLYNANYIKQIKSGEIDYLIVVEQVESLIYECDNIVEQGLSVVSGTFDEEVVNTIILSTIEMEFI